MPGMTPEQDQAARCAEIPAQLAAAFPIDPLTDSDALELLELYRICNAEPDTYQTQVYEPPRTRYSGGVEQWRPLVAGQFDEGEVDRALCLMGYESGGDPNAKNPNSTASGLFQILRFWWEDWGLDPFVPEYNVWMAAQIQNIQGWTAWSPYNRGLCH